MTIESQTSRNDYTGNGATSVFPYAFRIFNASELRVTQRTTGGTETTLVLNTDYTVDGVGNRSGGNVTLTAGALTSGYALTIRRVMPLTQTTDIRNQGAYLPELHENQFDRHVMIAQQQQDEIERVLRLPETEDGILTLPTTNSRKSMLLGFDGNGDPIAVAPGSVSSATFLSLIPQSSAPAAQAGRIYFDQVTGQFYFAKDGSNWRLALTENYVKLTGQTSFPTAEAGLIFYHSTDQQFYCCKDGTNWSVMG